MSRSTFTSGVAAAGVALGIGAAALTLGTAVAAADTGTDTSSAPAGSSTPSAAAGHGAPNGAASAPRPSTARGKTATGASPVGKRPAAGSVRRAAADPHSSPAETRAPSPSDTDTAPHDGDSASAISTPSDADGGVTDSAASTSTETGATTPIGTTPTAARRDVATNGTDHEDVAASAATAVPPLRVAASPPIATKTAVKQQISSLTVVAETVGTPGATAPTAASVGTPGVADTTGSSAPAAVPSTMAALPARALAPFTGLDLNPLTLLSSMFNSVVSLIQRTFFNQSPTTRPLTYVQGTNGVVVGTLGATDAEGDPLRYRLVSQATNGVVTLTSNGAYVYTPSQEFATTGGTDTFTVAVDDIGWHLHLFNGNGTVVTQVPVTVTPTTYTAPDTSVGSSRGFDVYNLTSKPMRYLGISSGSAESEPAYGTTFLPGEHAHFEVTFHFFDDTEAWADFAIGTAVSANAGAGMLVESYTGTSVAGCRGGVECTPSGGGAETSVVVFLDPPGSIVEVGSSDAQRQANLLQELCGNQDVGASCGFSPTRQEKLFTESAPVSPVLYNDTAVEQSMSHATSLQEGYSDSVGVSAKIGFKLFEVINAEIQASYGHTWSTSHTWTDTITIKVPAYTEASIWSAAPMDRVYGNFSLRLGNTTYLLDDVYFDSPDESASPVYRPHYEPIPHDPTPPASGA
jgi:hypothetical protein